MKIVRFQAKRFLILIAVVVTLLVMYLLRNDEEEISDCFLSNDALKQIESLLESIQKPLEDLRLTYFLCYNTLWGALKIKGPLPWHNGVDLCVLNKEVAAVDEGFFIRTFKRHNLNIAYNSAGGYYKVSKFNELFPSATITVFEEDSTTHQMRRVGFIHRMLPPNACEELNCFPPDLIASPIPTISFGQIKVPAPRDGIEIQKYLFPYTWWKEIAPQNCRE